MSDATFPCRKRLYRLRRGCECRGILGQRGLRHSSLMPLLRAVMLASITFTFSPSADASKSPAPLPFSKCVTRPSSSWPPRHVPLTRGPTFPWSMRQGQPLPSSSWMRVPAVSLVRGPATLLSLMPLLKAYRHAGLDDIHFRLEGGRVLGQSLLRRFHFRRA